MNNYMYSIIVEEFHGNFLKMDLDVAQQNDLKVSLPLIGNWNEWHALS